MSGFMHVTILGCGSSGGTPRANGDWGACDPSNPRNQRTRCGLLIQKWRDEPLNAHEATTILIDTAPELRQQLARAKPTHLDAIVYSHDHADQVHGIDDVRAFYLANKRNIRAYMDAPTRASITNRFAYCFAGDDAIYPALLEIAPDIKPFEPFTIEGPGGEIELVPLEQDHGFSKSLGFRIGPFGYSNDVKTLPEKTLDLLEGVSIWVVDALRERPAPTHANLAQALDWIEHLKPKHSVLINLHSELDYASLAAKLPPGVEPAYDGMRLDVPL